MSFWQKQDMEARILSILRDVDQVPAGRAGERPFLSAYQVAIELARRHPEVAAALGWTIGGARTGKGYSLAQYLASQLSRYVRDHPAGQVEQVLFSNRDVRDLCFACGDELIHSSVTATSPTLALYRWRDTGEARPAALPSGAQARQPLKPAGGATEGGQPTRQPAASAAAAARRSPAPAGQIAGLTVDDWRTRIAASNAQAMARRHQYPPQEGAFLRHCCQLSPANVPPLLRLRN